MSFSTWRSSGKMFLWPSCSWPAVYIGLTENRVRALLLPLFCRSVFFSNVLSCHFPWKFPESHTPCFPFHYLWCRSLGATVWSKHAADSYQCEEIPSLKHSDGDLRFLIWKCIQTSLSSRWSLLSRIDLNPQCRQINKFRSPKGWKPHQSPQQLVSTETKLPRTLDRECALQHALPWWREKRQKCWRLNNK